MLTQATRNRLHQMYEKKSTTKVRCAMRAFNRPKLRRSAWAKDIRMIVYGVLVNRRRRA